jgi:hypothetical protein
MSSTESLLAIVSIIGTIIGIVIQWQLLVGNSLIKGAKELLDEIKRQQNQNAQILEAKISVLKADIDKDIENTADINLQLSQNLRDTKVAIDTILTDLRQTNLQLLAKIEVLNQKVENGNGHK